MMESYQDFCHEIAEVIVEARELDAEEYSEWRRLVPELVGEHNALAEKVLDIVDAYRNMCFMA